MEIQTSETSTRKSRPYFLVFLVLAVFTGLEVAASYLPESFKIPILVILAATKAVLVVLFFMHLKYDQHIFRLPFILALAIILPLVLVIVVVMPMLFMINQ